MVLRLSVWCSGGVRSQKETVQQVTYQLAGGLRSWNGAANKLLASSPAACSKGSGF